jgi:GTPase SAR1 family protein
MSKRKSEIKTADEDHKKKSVSPLTLNILDAIRSLKNPLGSSASAILKVLININQYDKDRSKQLNKILKNAVENGLLIQIKQSYLVKDDPLYEDLAEKIEIVTEIIFEDGPSVKKGDHVVIGYKVYAYIYM